MRAAAVLVAVLLAGCAHPPPPAADASKVDRLLVLVRERLELAPAVAQAKWNSGAPIEDLPREREILDAVARAAPGYGLEPRAAVAFFGAQIEAGKVVQQALHRDWRAQGRPPFAAAPDLGRELRPAFDRLTPELLAALGEAQPAIARAGGRALVAEAAGRIMAGAPGGAAAEEAALAPLYATGN